MSKGTPFLVLVVKSANCHRSIFTLSKTKLYLLLAYIVVIFLIKGCLVKVLMFIASFISFGIGGEYIDLIPDINYSREAIQYPVLIIDSISEVTTDEATINFTIESMGDFGTGAGAVVTLRWGLKSGSFPNEKRLGAWASDSSFSIQIDQLLSDTTYFYSFLIQDPQHGYYHCDTNSFKTDILHKVYLARPEFNETILSNTPAFYWKSEGVDTLYDTLFIDTDPNPYDADNRFPVHGENSFTLPEELTTGINYYWGVKSRDKNTTITSTVNVFRITKEYSGGLFYDSAITIDSTLTDAFSVFSSDVDGDGDMDIICGNDLDSYCQLYIYRNGDTLFTKDTIVESIEYLGKVNQGNIYSNGTMGIVTTSRDGHRVLSISNLNNNYSAVSTISTNTENPKEAVVSDMDGDGDLDIIATGWSYDEINLYTKTNSGYESIRIQGHNNKTGAGPITISSLGNTGEKDLIYANTSNGSLFVRSKSLGVKSGYTVIANGIKNPVSVKSADFDLDGFLDILVASTEAVYWVRNNGDGTFSEPLSTDLKFDENITGAYPADFNGDGLIDIVIGTRKRVVWAQNFGSGLFMSETIGFYDKGSIYDRYHVYPADVDNDGDVDILAGGPSSLVWFENRTPKLQLRIPAADIELQFEDELEYSLPSDNFVNVEGADSIEISVSALPKGLKYSDGEIKGVADTIGEFAITVRATSGEYTSFDMFRIVITEPTAITNPIKSNRKTNVTILPNPVSYTDASVDILLPEFGMGIWSIVIFDALGNTVNRAELVAEEKSVYTWDLNSLHGIEVASGSYLLIAQFRASDGHTQQFSQMIGIRK